MTAAGVTAAVRRLLDRLAREIEALAAEAGPLSDAGGASSASVEAPPL